MLYFQIQFINLLFLSEETVIKSKVALESFQKHK